MRNINFIYYLFVRILFYYVIIMFFLQLTTTHSQVLLKFFATKTPPNPL
eukprot:gene3577-2528_t